MTIKEKAEAFASDTLIDGRYDRISIDERGCTVWELFEFSTGLISYTTFNLATKQPMRKSKGVYVMSFCYSGKGSLSRLMQLGKIYGFTIDSRGYFVATKNVRLMNGERLKKGDVLGYVYCAFLAGGKNDD